MRIKRNVHNFWKKHLKKEIKKINYCQKQKLLQLQEYEAVRNITIPTENNFTSESQTSEHMRHYVFNNTFNTIQQQHQFMTLHPTKFQRQSSMQQQQKISKSERIYNRQKQSNLAQELQQVNQEHWMQYQEGNDEDLEEINEEDPIIPKMYNEIVPWKRGRHTHKQRLKRLKPFKLTPYKNRAWRNGTFDKPNLKNYLMLQKSYELADRLSRKPFSPVSSFRQR